jgi:hypothetical protein
MNLPELKTRNCRWIDVPGASDARGSVNFLQCGKDLDFEPKRLFFLRDVAPGGARGPYSHRDTRLVLIAVGGECRCHLDDGAVKETVALNDPARGLYIAPWVWHELTDFAPGTSIVVLASTQYQEAEQMRDYKAFQSEVRTHIR